jgi:hypothetical protein
MKKNDKNWPGNVAEMKLYNLVNRLSVLRTEHNSSEAHQCVERTFRLGFILYGMDIHLHSPYLSFSRGAWSKIYLYKLSFLCVVMRTVLYVFSLLLGLKYENAMNKI